MQIEYIYTEEKDRVCPECGKRFRCDDVNWAYKRQRTSGQGTAHDSYIYYCSWKCLRKPEKEGRVKG